MKFIIKESKATLHNVNPRPELHGQDPKPAADLKLSLMVHKDELDQLHPDLKGMIYTANDGSGADLADQASDVMLRFPQLAMPIKWEGEQVGGKVTVHRGISAKSDLVIEKVVVNNFTVEALEGGTVIVGFRVQFHPDEKAIGKLCMLTGSEVVISVEPPAEGEVGDAPQEPADTEA